MAENLKTACEQRCPRFQVCARLVRMGEQHLRAAAITPAYSDRLIDMEGPDGMVSLSEFFGAPDTVGMSEDEREAHTRAGQDLATGGRELGKILLGGCDGAGPLELEGGQLICRSTNREMVDFTEADLA